ncbi:cysteine peptidase family C39 domain-containing protein [Mycoplasma sp. ATU-Cv-508]|uniref:cysteine peptidase family C39 domain-containing protein n=1 Tax=Mycoplasma sp. ATU-Cv-508 TaxID=2048001 RepID=UPI000FDDB05F
MQIRRQLDSSDCGLSVIQALHHRFYRRWLGLNFLRAQTVLGSRGLTAFHLVALAKNVGIILTGYRLSFDELKAVKQSQKWWVALVGTKDSPLRDYHFW